jgi:adenylate cyclase
MCSRMDISLNEKKILIVDDTPENITILSGLLATFQKMVATGGEKALELIRGDNPPDLVLLDVEMPGLNGFEVCRQLKSDPETQRIPIIFLTGNLDKKMTVEGFKLGASDFMTKPFDPDELMVRITTQLELSDSRERLEGMVFQLETSSRLLKNSNEEVGRQRKALEDERNRTDSLLLNILPEHVARELKEKGSITPRHYPIATVLFTDLAGFTKITKGMDPTALVDELNHLFVGFDRIIKQHNMEKIKTIGDGYMAVGGIPVQNSTNPVEAIEAAMELIAFVHSRREENVKNRLPPWEVRIGIHTGEIIAGVIGSNKFTYDIWGATVNIASRMESAGEPGKVNISGITYQLVKDKYRCVRRGNIEVKNMGKMEMYFAEERINGL